VLAIDALKAIDRSTDRLASGCRFFA